jgi:DNA-directed RNA polymerase I and III subunit RPAC1
MSSVKGIPRPIVKNIRVDGEVTSYDMEQMNVSIVNALRRVILSEIDTVVIRTEPHEKNDVNFIKNNTRLNNEMLKHRLSCIPIHLRNTTQDLSNFVLEVHVKNEDTKVRLVTTQDFKIKNTSTGTYLKDQEVRKMFPPNPITGEYIVFTRLLPKIVVGSNCEEIHLEAKFSVGNAKENSAFNVASCCSYQMMPDPVKQREAWSEKEGELTKQGLSGKDIDREKDNWYALEAMRYYKDDAFIFNLESVGVFEPNDLLKKACVVIKDKLQNVLNNIREDKLDITKGKNTMECHDIILENEDYTLGKIIEYSLYKNYFVDNHTLGFVGFHKFHPHDNFSVIRIAKQEDPTKPDQYMEKGEIHMLLENACEMLMDTYTTIMDSV